MPCTTKFWMKLSCVKMNSTCVKACRRILWVCPSTMAKKKERKKDLLLVRYLHWLVGHWLLDWSVIECNSFTDYWMLIDWLIKIVGLHVIIILVCCLNVRRLTNIYCLVIDWGQSKHLTLSLNGVGHANI